MSSQNDTSALGANPPPPQCVPDTAEYTKPSHIPATSTDPSPGIQRNDPMGFTKEQINEPTSFPRLQPVGVKSNTNLPEPAIDTESKSRTQIQLFEAKHALSVGKSRKNRESSELQPPTAGKKIDSNTPKADKTEALSGSAQESPIDIFLTTEEDLNERFKNDNPDIKGEIKLTGVDLPGLVQYSVSKLRKSKCLSISMPSFGLFNKVLLLTFDDDTTVLARIPFNYTRARMLSMKSEAATMTYIRLNRPSIPVARVYAYEANVENLAKVPFMLIEKMPGEHIYNHVLYDKDPSKAEQVLKNIANVQAELAKPLPFNMIGNLFFKKDLPVREKESSKALHGAGARGDSWSKTTEDSILGVTENGTDPEFEVGPLIFENPYDSDIVASGEAGPFKTLKDLFFFLVQHQRACSEKIWRELLKDTDVLPPPHEWSPSPGTVTDFTKRCLQLCAVIHALKTSDEYSGLCFYHWDLRMGNILINDSTLEITAVLDWDDVRVVPMLLSAAHPEEIRERFCWNEPTRYIIPETNTAAEEQSISRWWWREHYRFNMCILDERFAIGGGGIWEEAEIAHRLYKLLFSDYNEWLDAYWVA